MTLVVLSPITALLLAFPSPLSHLYLHINLESSVGERKLKILVLNNKKIRVNEPKFSISLLSLG